MVNRLSKQKVTKLCIFFAFWLWLREVHVSAKIQPQTGIDQSRRLFLAPEIDLTLFRVSGNKDLFNRYDKSKEARDDKRKKERGECLLLEVGNKEKWDKVVST